MTDIVDSAGLVAELERLWRETIPISAQMGIEVLGYEDGELTLKGALDPNLNLHGTAFGGSLFAVAALAGWGALWLALRSRGLEAKIVLVDARIEFKRPVAEDMICRCRLDATVQAPNLAQLERTGSGIFPLTCTIAAKGRRAVQFDGEYAARL